MHKTILRLAIPNILSNLSVPLLGIADTALMGRMEDSALYIGAIALGSIIFNFIYWGFGFLRMTVTGMSAQAFGETNQEESGLILFRALGVAFLGSLLLLLLHPLIGEWGIEMLKGEEEVKDLARSYFFIRIYAAPATIASFVLHGWFLGMQNARIPMILTIVVNLSNILLNFVFVFGWGMKSDGVALATVCAQYTGLLLATGLFLYNYSSYLSYFSWTKLVHGPSLKRFFQLGSDILIRTICLIAVFTFFTNESSGVNKTILAVNTILLQYFYTLSFGVDGFAYAAESLVGRFKGEKQADKLNKVVKLLFIWGIAIALTISLVYVLGGKQLMRLFTDDPELIQAAVPYLYWMVAVSLSGTLAFLWDGIYIGATATKPMRNYMLVATLAFFLTYYLSHSTLGNHGLWLSMVIFMLARSITLSLVSRRHIFISAS